LTTRLLKIPEVEARLMLSRTTVYQLIGTGDLRTVHVGRAVRVPESELERFVVLKMTEADGLEVRDDR
jgi:excisionase family DNA binding protein